jgi:carboxylate-amine ligase
MDENRFLAARDGIDAELLDARRGRRVPAAGRLATLVDACWPHARALARARAGAARPPGRTRARSASARSRAKPASRAW